MEQAKKKLGWKINAEIDRVEKKMSRKGGSTTVVKQHLTVRIGVSSLNFPLSLSL